MRRILRDALVGWFVRGWGQKFAKQVAKLGRCRVYAVSVEGAPHLSNDIPILEPGVWKSRW